MSCIPLLQTKQRKSTFLRCPPNVCWWLNLSTIFYKMQSKPSCFSFLFFFLTTWPFCTAVCLHDDDAHATKRMCSFFCTVTALAAANPHHGTQAAQFVRWFRSIQCFPAMNSDTVIAIISLPSLPPIPERDICAFFKTLLQMLRKLVQVFQNFFPAMWTLRIYACCFPRVLL